MKLHELKNTPGARRSRVRVGRGTGSGLGKTSGRGHKGQYARSGHKHKPGFEGGQMRFARKLPKRGFKSLAGAPLAVVNVGDLEACGGSEVTLATLKAAGLVRTAAAGVKLLGTGTLTRKLTVKVQAVSAGARTRVEAAGGTVEIVPAAAGA